MKPALKYVLVGLPFLALYVALSSAIRTSEWIWYLTRIFGLVSFFFLFISVSLGEMRLLSIRKGKFKLFKYHVPISIFALFLVVLHFISAVFDKFKWGVGLEFTNYLGFNFSDKWLTLLSLGTLAMYFMLIVGATSSKPSIRALGFKKWKLVHLLSYLSFIFAFIHSINLGTDVKTSALSVVLKPLVMFCFWFIIALLVVRILKSFNIFTEQAEINLTIAFFVMLLVVGVFVLSAVLTSMNEIPQEKVAPVQDLRAEIEYYLNANSLLTEQINRLTTEVNADGGSK